MAQFEPIFHNPEEGYISTKLRNFTSFEEFESILDLTIIHIKTQKQNTWLLDLSEVLIVGQQHQNYLVEP